MKVEARTDISSLRQSLMAPFKSNNKIIPGTS